VVIHGTNFNVTGSVLNYDKLPFSLLPVATFGGIDRGSEVEVVTGAHVYPADPIGVQWDSSPAIWKVIEAH
jgi:hypothetical protein